MFRAHRQEGVFPDLVLVDFVLANDFRRDEDMEFFDQQQEDMSEFLRSLAVANRNTINELEGFAANFKGLCQSEDCKGMQRRREVRKLSRTKEREYDICYKMIENLEAEIKTEDGQDVTMEDLLDRRTWKSAELRRISLRRRVIRMLWLLDMSISCRSFAPKLEEHVNSTTFEIC